MLRGSCLWSCLGPVPWLVYLLDGPLRLAPRHVAGPRVVPSSIILLTGHSSLTWALDHPFTQVLWDFTLVSQGIAYDSVTPSSHLIPSPGAALLCTP